MFDSLVFGVEVRNANTTSSTLRFHAGSKFSQILVQMVLICLTTKAEMLSVGLENCPDLVVADNQTFYKAIILCQPFSLAFLVFL